MKKSMAWLVLLCMLFGLVALPGYTLRSAEEPVQAPIEELAAESAEEEAPAEEAPAEEVPEEAVQPEIVSETAETPREGDGAAAVCSIGETGYEALTAALAAVQNGETITLLQNVTDYIVVANGQEIILDLNGFVVNPTFGSCTLTVGAGGKLTILDSNPEIEHKFSADFGGISLDETNGTIVYKGGIITGLGVRNDGTLILQGGSIVGNASWDNFGGLYNGGKLDLDGKVVIENNSYRDSAANLYLASTDVTVTEKFSGSVGVTFDDKGSKALPFAGTAEQAACFTCDNSNYNLKYDTENQKLYLEGKPATITFDVNGGTGTPAQITGKVEESVQFPGSDEVTRKGYSLENWASTSEDNEAGSFLMCRAGGDYTITEAGAQTFKAWWTPVIDQQPKASNAYTVVTEAEDVSYQWYRRDITEQAITQDKMLLSAGGDGTVWDGEIISGTSINLCSMNSKSYVSCTIEFPDGVPDGLAFSYGQHADAPTSLGNGKYSAKIDPGNGLTITAGKSFRIKVSTEVTENVPLEGETGKQLQSYDVGKDYFCRISYTGGGYENTLDSGVVTVEEAAIEFNEALTADGSAIGSTGVYLEADIKLTTDITVAEGSTLNLDLRGHTLTGSGKGSVITNNGTLNIYDTVGGGKITGGSAEYGGGIYNNGTVSMDAGTITGNKAAKSGGGIYNNGTLLVGGKDVISGNTNASGAADNVFLPEGKILTLASESNPAADGMKIGVRTEKEVTADTPVALTEAKYTLKNFDYDTLNCFAADDARLVIELYDGAISLISRIVDQPVAATDYCFTVDLSGYQETSGKSTIVEWFRAEDTDFSDPLYTDELYLGDTDAVPGKYICRVSFKTGDTTDFFLDSDVVDYRYYAHIVDRIGDHGGRTHWWDYYVVCGEDGKLAALPDSTTSDIYYVFRGWYCDGKPFDFDTVLTRNIELTAYWGVKPGVDPFTVYTADNNTTAQIQTTGDLNTVTASELDALAVALKEEAENAEKNVLVTSEVNDITENESIREQAGTQSDLVCFSIGLTQTLSTSQGSGPDAAPAESATTAITDTGDIVLEFVYPYDMTGKSSSDISVYRQHKEEGSEEATVTAFVYADLSSARYGQDGTFYVEGTNDKAEVHIFSSKFSDFGIARQVSTGEALEKLKNTVAEDIPGAVQSLVSGAGMKDFIKQLDGDNEEAYAALDEKAGETAVSVDAALQSTLGSISVVGACLNKTEAEQTVSLTLAPVEMTALTAGLPKLAAAEGACVFSMDLEIGGTTVTELTAPVIITLPVPNGKDPASMILVHYHGQSAKVLYPTVVQGEGETVYVRFVLTGFSNFVLTERSVAAGDVNGKDGVDILDVLHLLKKVAGQSVDMAYEGDVNNDESVDILDVLHLLKYVAGQSVTIY